MPHAMRIASVTSKVWRLGLGLLLKRALIPLLLVSLAICRLSLPHPAQAAASLELYGTFHAMGVIVTLAAGDDPDQNAIAGVEYRLNGSSVYQAGFPLTRVNATRFAGSLFWLQPGMAYDVRVTFSDPGGLLNGVVVQATASTRAEITIPPPTKSYYVSPTGSCVACSLGVPCSFTTGLNSAQPG